MSLPVWECGLKLFLHIRYQYEDKVTPCMGVWIEMECTNYFKKVEVGSLPVWECGLKLN